MDSLFETTKFTRPIMFTFITLYLLVEKILAWLLVTGTEKKQETKDVNIFSVL